MCWNVEPKFSMDAYSKTQESKLTFRTPKSVLMNNKKSVEFCVTAVRFGHMSNLRGLCFVSTHFQYFFLTLTDAFWPLCKLVKQRAAFRWQRSAKEEAAEEEQEQEQEQENDGIYILVAKYR